MSEDVAVTGLLNVKTEEKPINVQQYASVDSLISGTDERTVKQLKKARCIVLKCRNVLLRGKILFPRCERNINKLTNMTLK